MSSTRRNIGSFIKGALAIPNTAITAGGSGDNTEVTGPSIDRRSLANTNHLSAKAIIALRGTLASGNTATVAANFQDSANDSDWADYGTALAATTVLNAAGGALTNGTGVAELSVDLSGARRYVRLQALPDLSASATDTAQMSGVIVFGGGQELPES